jgi:hypothetical protein
MRFRWKSRSFQEGPGRKRALAVEFEAHTAAVVQEIPAALFEGLVEEMEN